MDALLEEDFPERIREYVKEDRRKHAPEAHRSVEKVREEFMELIGGEKYAIRNW